MSNDRFAVTSRVPVPSAEELRSRCTVYPFDRMQVGDSFEIKDPVTRWRVHRAMLNYSRRHKAYRFAIKAKSPAGWRCWRVAA